MTKQSRSTYKRRRAANGAERYANFSNGVQNSSETVAGTQVTHRFKASTEVHA